MCWSHKFQSLEDQMTYMKTRRWIRSLGGVFIIATGKKAYITDCRFKGIRLTQPKLIYILYLYTKPPTKTRVEWCFQSFLHSPTNHLKRWFPTNKKTNINGSGPLVPHLQGTVWSDSSLDSPSVEPKGFGTQYLGGWKRHLSQRIHGTGVFTCMNA